MVDATFTIDGDSIDLGLKTVSPSSSVALALVDTTGVESVTWTCVGTHDAGTTEATITAAITPAGAPSGVTATLAFPAGANGQNYRLQCSVKGAAILPDVRYGVVGSTNGGGTVPAAKGERANERHPVQGWTDVFNASIGIGTYMPLGGGDFTGAVGMGGFSFYDVDTITAEAATNLTLDVDTGQSHLLQVNSVTVAAVTGAGAAVTGTLSATTSVTGATLVGNTSATTPLLTGPAASDLSLNAVTGQSVFTKINGVTKLEIDGTTATFGVDVDAGGNDIGNIGLFTVEAASAAASAAGSITVDFSDTTRRVTTMSESITSVTLTPPASGEGSFLWTVIQPGAGGPYTLTGWPGTVSWGPLPAPTLSVGANKEDLISLSWDGSMWKGSYGLGY